MNNKYQYKYNDYQCNAYSGSKPVSPIFLIPGCFHKLSMINFTWTASEAPTPLGSGLDAEIVSKLFFNRLNIRNYIVYLHRETYSTDKTQSWQQAKEIVESKELSWLQKYEFIFSESISVQTINFFDWYDPDTDHRDDVKAFMYAFEKYLEDNELIEKQIEYNY